MSAVKSKLTLKDIIVPEVSKNENTNIAHSPALSDIIPVSKVKEVGIFTAFEVLPITEYVFIIDVNVLSV